MNIDTILVLDNQINEGTQADSRIGIATDYRSEIYSLDKIAGFGSKFEYGDRLKRSVASSLGRDFNVRVSDFGSDVVVYVEYNNYVTSRSAGLSFLIKILNKSGHGVIKTSTVRYRTINDINQAVSYISSRCSSLKSQTNQS